MGRLKKDHSGWKTHGLWKKYQFPKIDERPKHKSKKDTKKWCRGKVGVEHKWVREQQKRWDNELAEYFGSYITISCDDCDKSMYKRLSKVSHIPMRIFIMQESEVYVVAVKRSDGTYLVH